MFCVISNEVTVLYDVGILLLYSSEVLRLITFVRGSWYTINAVKLAGISSFYCIVVFPREPPESGLTSEGGGAVAWTRDFGQLSHLSLPYPLLQTCQISSVINQKGK